LKFTIVVTVILLAVAILAFAGLGYQTVPMSTTQTVTQSSTEALGSYSLYMVVNVVSYTTSMVPAFAALGLTSGTFSVLAVLGGCPADAFDNLG
jgi:Na+/H+ antiporter NhaC